MSSLKVCWNRRTLDREIIKEVAFALLRGRVVEPVEQSDGPYLNRVVIREKRPERLLSTPPSE